jgi:hypothetical protein
MRFPLYYLEKKVLEKKEISTQSPTRGFRLKVLVPKGLNDL